MKFRRFVLLMAAVALPLCAQNPYARITGRITDSANALVAGASVRVVQIETNIVSTTVSNTEGVYDIRNLHAGTYRVEVEVQGFKRHERGPIEVRIGEVLTLEVKLELGAVSESITVGAEAPLLESATASLGQTTDNRRINELPMTGSNLNYLVQLAPGMVSTNAPMHGWLPQARDMVSNIGGLGTRARSNEFTLDGVPNMERSGIIAFVVPPELVQEMQVQTAPSDASVGHFTGAHVNVVLKSGTNALHGALWGSHVSRPLLSHPFFVNRSLYDTRTGPPTKAKVDSLFPYSKTNRYRGTVSGPVVIPKLFDGHNRTFITLGADVVQRSYATGDFSTVPTAAERQGDFSQLLSLGSQYQIYDPATIAPAAAGRFSRQPLAGNLIPAGRITPMAKKLLDYYPLPNVVGTVDGRNNYNKSPNNVVDYRSQIIRVDQVISQNNRMYATYTQSLFQGLDHDTFSNLSTGNDTDERYKGFALDDVMTLRPDLVVNLRYGLTRLLANRQAPSHGFDLAGLGLPAALAGQVNPKSAGMPQLVMDGFTTLGRDSGYLSGATFHYFAGDVSHIRGAHSLRMGTELRLLRESNYTWGFVSPSYTFGTMWAKGPLDSSPAAPLGQGLASFLLGLPTDGFIDLNPSFAEQSVYLAAFVQDDWKITRKLTLNLGLRYDVEFPTTERYDRANRGFDFASTNPVQNAARTAYARSPIAEVPVDQFRTLGGLQFANVAGLPRGLWNRDSNNFAPRLGLAWLFHPTTVVRANYGVIFDTMGANQIDVTQQGFSQRTSMVPSLDNGLTFRATLANPFPDGLLIPAGASAGLSTFLGRAPSFFTPTRRTPYMQRWGLSLQHQIGQKALIEVGYMGTRGTKLGLARDYDPMPARYLSTLAVRDQATIDYLSQATPNPFYGLPGFAGSNIQGQTVPRSQLLKPFPQFSNITTTVDNGFSWYHAGFIRAERRFAQGFTLSGTYTWSKFMEAVENLNVQDPVPTHVISPMDRPHHLTANGVYELPFGRGKRWGAFQNPMLNHALAGWSVQGIYQFQSGAPIGFADIIFRGNLSGMVLPRSERKVERWFNVDAGFERSAAQQLASHLRTFPLRLTGLRANGFNNWDLSLFKTFQIREGLKFQLRAESVDALNHPAFNAPNTNPANTLFGQVDSTVFSEQRKITIAGKLIW